METKIMSATFIMMINGLKTLFQLNREKITYYLLSFGCSKNQSRN